MKLQVDLSSAWCKAFSACLCDWRSRAANWPMSLWCGLAEETLEKCGCCPWFIKNGDSPVKAFGQLLIVNWTMDSQSVQSSWRYSTYSWRYCASSWFILSACPFVSGWYAVEMFWVIRRCLHNSRMYSEANWGPRSEMIFQGTPKIGKTWSR